MKKSKLFHALLLAGLIQHGAVYADDTVWDDDYEDPVEQAAAADDDEISYDQIEQQEAEAERLAQEAEIAEAEAAAEAEAEESSSEAAETSVADVESEEVIEEDEIDEDVESNDSGEILAIEDVELGPDDIFKNAYVHFKAEKWESAAQGFLGYINLTTSDDKNYEWAEFFLGVSLDNLGFTHAAIDRFSSLAARKPNTKIVTYVLDMFEKISRTQPFDYDQVILQVVNDKDYGFINGEINGFIHYYQGIQDWKTGHRDWAEDHFVRIPKDSYYYNRYLYHQALYQVEIEKPKKALDQLGVLLRQEDLDQKLADEAMWTAARLHYELGEMKEAAFLYKKIKTPVVEQASFLLEQAWIEYQKKDYERAMGFLYAFEAPSFRQFFTPEYFILKSFIYKDVCHYESALSVVTEFTQRYGKSLEAIYNRKEASDVESEELLYVILARKGVKKIWEFIQLLEKERSHLDDIEEGVLQQYVADVYSLQIEESSYYLQNIVETEYESHANDLLQYEEESNLMRYEIGVDMYQRVADTVYQGQAKKSKKKDDEKAQVVFPFQHEYWNDELGFYTVKLPNKCETFDDWDLFF